LGWAGLPRWPRATGSPPCVDFSQSSCALRSPRAAPASKFAPRCCRAPLSAAVVVVVVVVLLLLLLWRALRRCAHPFICCCISASHSRSPPGQLECTLLLLYPAFAATHWHRPLFSRPRPGRLRPLWLVSPSLTASTTTRIPRLSRAALLCSALHCCHCCHCCHCYRCFSASATSPPLPSPPSTSSAPLSPRPCSPLAWSALADMRLPAPSP
jgi:hypothetical protein